MFTNLITPPAAIVATGGSKHGLQENSCSKPAIGCTVAISSCSANVLGKTDTDDTVARRANIATIEILVKTLELESKRIKSYRVTMVLKK